MIRVLQDLSALDGGGVAKLLYDYYRYMDHTKIHFDFMIYNYYDEGIYEKPLREMGCKIYKLPPYASNPKKCAAMQRKIIKKGSYDILHTHFGIGAFRILKIAKECGVPKRMVHSHIAYEPYSMKTKVANILKKWLNKHYATHLLACGTDAGRFLWGDRAVRNGKVHIMKNAIDTDLFVFDENIRVQKRKELDVDDKLVIGIVGRLSEQKNYPFLFRVYKKVLEKRNDTVLLVVGRGLEEESIKKLAHDMGIEDKVRFLGVRDDVSQLLNAFDIFVLPSLYEGLPVVLIEAQANGVTELVSDRITKEMDITDLITFMEIDHSEDEWADKICDLSTDISERRKYKQLVAEAGYEVKAACHEMEKFYYYG